MKTPCIILFLFLVLTGLNGQSTPAFRIPIKGEVRLSGTFGELRSNHFHTGIDIKSTTGRGGDPILAAADGYIERIRISAVGYGRALYIAHSNGYSTVYAHLDRFHPKIEKYIQNYQQKHETSQLDLYPLTESWCVELGDTIGFMGNSGSSVGPHLHFEVRHTESEAPVNPLRWFSEYIHGETPFARKVKIYQLDERGNVQREYAYRLRRIGGDFVPANGSIKLSEGGYGWAVQAIHPFNHWRNKNGLYALESYVDGHLLYAVCMDSLPFELNRYINAHIDYPMYCSRKQRLHSLFALPHQETSCVRYDQDRGTILLSDSSSHEVRIYLSGIEGQSAEVRFTLKAKKDNGPNEVVDSKEGQVDPFSTFSYSDDYVRFHARPKTFYSQHPLEISTVCEKGPAGLLPTAYVDTDCHPFHKPSELRFLDLPSRPDSVREKWYIGHRVDGNWVDVGGYWEGNDFVAQVRKEGQYRICVAGPPPELVTRRRTFRSGQPATFRVKPGTPSQFRTKDVEIQVTYGGQFLLSSYDKKGGRLSLTLPENGSANDSLRIKLLDRWGQSRDYSFPVLD